MGQCRYGVNFCVPQKHWQICVKAYLSFDKASFNLGFGKKIEKLDLDCVVLCFLFGAAQLKAYK
jgi:hypothetical protein